jgi:hypothetical protein
MLSLPQDMKRLPKWMNIVIKAILLFVALIISNFVLIYLFGPQLWFYAGYFFGDDRQTTLGVFMLVEGGVLLALGSLFSSGSFENLRYGKYGKSYAGFSKEDWEQRRKQTENPRPVIEILLLAGSLTLVCSFPCF